MQSRGYTHDYSNTQNTGAESEEIVHHLITLTPCLLEYNLHSKIVKLTLYTQSKHLGLGFFLA